MYVQSNKLLLADVFNNFQKVCLEIYELEASHLLFASRLSWKVALIKAKIKLDLVADVNVLLMVRGKIRRAVH